MPRSSEKDCTRYGVITTSATKIGSEERFSWQKQTSSTDGMYDLPDQRCHRTVTFGTALRMSEESNSDAVKRRAGPGTYECSTCYDKVSDFKNKQGNRFALAPRESLDLKTPSPGPVYVISNQYWNGAEKGIKIGFNCDTRPPLCNPSPTINADMLYPKLPEGKSITIGGRHKARKAVGGPGMIYDIHEPKARSSFSFGKGRQDRFTKTAFLPEIDY